MRKLREEKGDKIEVQARVLAVAGPVQARVRHSGLAFAAYLVKVGSDERE